MRILLELGYCWPITRAAILFVVPNPLSLGFGYFDLHCCLTNTFAYDRTSSTVLSFRGFATALRGFGKNSPRFAERANVETSSYRAH